MTTTTTQQSLEDQFRQGMQRVAGTVCLVTASDESERWYGITATSIVSVSMSPPSLLACINTGSTVFGPIDRQKSFCVNVLTHAQQQHSARFSNPAEYEARFMNGDWRSHEGLPYLADAQVALFCDVAQTVVHGSHAVFIGNVRDVLAPAPIREPLIYFNRSYLSRESLVDAA